MNKKWNNYIIFWLSQALSQLGSSMTSYALILWMYQKTGSAFSVSLMTFCSFLPFVIVSMVSGSFVDRHYKKNILFWSDTIAAASSLAILLSYCFHTLAAWQIYAANLVVGFMNAFQSPASAVAIGIMVPENEYHRASGLNSFSQNLCTIFAPILAGSVFSYGGLKVVISLDLSTFLIAVLVLKLFIKIQEKIERTAKKVSNGLTGFKEGYGILREKRGILVSIKRRPKSNGKMIYYSAAISFLAGDLLMGLGQTRLAWCIAGLFASVPIPFVMAGQSNLIYKAVPKEAQGRVFAVRNAIQYVTIPIAILLGGYLADYVFEPMMRSEQGVAKVLTHLVGSGTGSGMAVMFLCTGTLGFCSCVLAYHNKNIQKLEEQIQ